MKSNSFFSRHTGLCISALFIILLAIVMVATCPDKAVHREAISNLISEVAGDMVGGTTHSNVARFGTTLVASGLTDKLYDKFFVTHNYILFSTCEYNFGGKQKTVAVGAFGHVFTMNSKQVEDWIREQTGSFSPLLGL